MQPDPDIIIINQSVHFSPEKNILYPEGRESDALTLNVPVSRCLALLLAHAGQVVPRQIFYSEVWEKQGMYVTDNTFYQNISLLRKMLRAAGLHENVIQTVPREGIRFSGTAEFLNRNAALTDNDTPVSAQEGVASSVTTIKASPVAMSGAKRAVASAVSVLFLGLALYYFWGSFHEQQDVFNKFSTLNLAACQVHYYGALEQKNIPATLALHSIPCKDNNVIFLTVNENHTRTAYTVCGRYTQNKQACHSWLYISEDAQ
jgi:DNA-binding winged helix-turn-helix (wHTH) protein